MTRILVADDHEVVRSGLRAILEKQPSVVGEAANGREAAQAALATRPGEAGVARRTAMVTPCRDGELRTAETWVPPHAPSGSEWAT
jgi:CheY-like chemotaxis protein